MIVIVSENTDGSTTEVMKWLKKAGYANKTLRVNIEDRVYLDELNLSDPKLTIDHDGRCIDLVNETSVIWFRRGNIVLSLRKSEKRRTPLNLFNNTESNEQVKGHLKFEAREIIEAINSPAGPKIIGGFGKGSVNKLKVLNLAKSVGLDIPYTVVVDQKEKLERFKASDPDIITKGLSDTLSFENDRVGYIVYTNEVDDETIESLPKNFFPSLFQRNVKKKIELRVFYWMGRIYAMAIFSQLDDQTSTDFRIYNRKKPNRMVPFQLPAEMEEKIHLLMEKVDLETGSLDFILDDEGKYVFLEVNPVGQFGMVSVPCNYFLEREIANTLMNYEDEFQKNQGQRQAVVAGVI